MHTLCKCAYITNHVIQETTVSMVTPGYSLDFSACSHILSYVYSGKNQDNSRGLPHARQIQDSIDFAKSLLRFEIQRTI